MVHHYRVEQGPGKALKVIANLNESIGGDTIVDDRGTRKANIARLKFESMLDGMEKDDVIALYTSAVALRYIVDSVIHTTEEHIDARWGLRGVERQ